MKLYKIAIVMLLFIFCTLPVRADSPSHYVMARYNETGITKSGYNTSDIPVLWVAVPVEQWPDLGHHKIHGKADGVSFIAVVLDTGTFGANCVEQMNGECWPIVLDMPTFHYRQLGFEGLSVPVSYQVRRDVWWGLL